MNSEHKQIVFASRNKGKIKEIQKLFAQYNYKVLSLSDYPEIADIPETGTSFEENAMIKATTVFSILQCPVLADDSGLEVAQLNWGPGVYSARYAGEHASDDENNRKLISELHGLPHPHSARYRCCAVYYSADKSLIHFGDLNGRIIDTPSGSEGFGYDPYFIPEGYFCTMAELTLEEKNRISHRGKAFKLLLNALLHGEIL
ncbi:MAG: RdgB/HAM1 family non-canonical purine NTP pyrophosphatase [Ignavibacteria bacterium]|nr:RdgB/HAM1 family non-canonical purine NTP pyrophosphatase [Ignavibacteria bacterium]